MISSLSSSTLASQLSSTTAGVGGGRPPPGPPPGPPPDAAQMSSDFMSDFDTDGNGTVDKSELSKVLSDQGIDNADDVASKMLSDLGATDGTVTKDQVDSALQSMKQQHDEDMASMGVRMRMHGGPKPAEASTDTAAGTDASSTSTSTATTADSTSSTTATTSGSTSSSSSTDSAKALEESVKRFVAMLGHYRAVEASGSSQVTEALAVSA